MKFVNLHSHYDIDSINDGLSSIKEGVRKAKKIGQKCCCETGHGSMAGYIELINECEKENIKPIVGCEFYYVDDLKKWNKEFEDFEEKGLKGEERKQERKRLRKNYHLILIAKNDIGLKNLYKLSYEANKNFYYRPRIDKKLIKKYSKGLICMSACMANKISQMLLNNLKGKALEEAVFFKTVFKNDFYVEMQFNELKEQKELNKYLYKISRKIKSKVVIGVDSHYTNKEDQKTHKTLLLMQGKKTYKDLEEGNDGVWEFDTKELYIKTYDEVKSSWKRFGKGIPKEVFSEGCESTVEIAKKIKKYNIDKSVKIYDVYPKIKDKDEALKKLCIKGMKKRGVYKKKEYRERLKLELKVIKNMEVSNYFFLVKSIVDEARKKMLIGLSRGSAGGSLVSYLLEITETDPIRFGLLFERFLDYSRGKGDLPDIDIDFEDNDQVKKDLIEKYGEDCACISAFSTYQISGLLRDLIRIHSAGSASDGIKLTGAVRKEIEEAKKDDEKEINELNIQDLEDNSNSLKSFLKKYPEIKKDCSLLLGKIRHIGKHAAGVVICENLKEKQPLISLKGEMQTVLEEGGHSHSSADCGFVKVDVLGLTTLGVIHDTLKLVSEKTGKSLEDLKKEIHPDNINLEDKKVYEHVFKKENYSGIFQFDTESAYPLIKKTKPDCFDDLVAINALNRPGPQQSGMAYDYGDLKRGKKEPEYFGNKIIKKILKSTYGLIIYQEQQMQLMNQLGNIDMITTNKVRKWFAKKMASKNPEIKKELLEIKKDFIKGSIKNKLSKKNAETIWERMEYFSDYSFNVAHSCAYALTAYQCCYLKTYYPLEFYVSLLNHEDMKKYEKIMNELKRNKIKVKGVDLNKSRMNFFHDGKNIFWGFSKVNGIGEKASLNIIESRDKKKIKGFQDFIQREDIVWRLVNKKVVETLINLEAFNFNKKVGEKFLIKFYNEWNQRKKKKGDSIKIAKEIAMEYYEGNPLQKLSPEEKQELEINHYKINLKYSAFKIKKRQEKIKRLISQKKAGTFKDNRNFVIAVVKNCAIVKDKNKKEMAFLDVTDMTGKTKQAIIFSSNYEKEIKNNYVYCVSGQSKDKYFIEKYINIDNLFKKA
jgi:DNA polymerase-3 subunit alpha